MLAGETLTAAVSLSSRVTVARFPKPAARVPVAEVAVMSTKRPSWFSAKSSSREVTVTVFSVSPTAKLTVVCGIAL